MIRKFLSYILISLIALQSAAALADLQQFHQSNIDHLTLERSIHSESTSNALLPEHSPTTPSSQYDGHHCCHCHSLTFFFSAESHKNIAIAQQGQNGPEYRFSYFSHLTAPDIRPPIA